MGSPPRAARDKHCELKRILMKLLYTFFMLFFSSSSLALEIMTPIQAAILYTHYHCTIHSPDIVTMDGTYVGVGVGNCDSAMHSWGQNPHCPEDRLQYTQFDSKCYACDIDGYEVDVFNYETPMCVFDGKQPDECSELNQYYQGGECVDECEGGQLDGICLDPPQEQPDDDCKIDDSDFNGIGLDGKRVCGQCGDGQSWGQYTNSNGDLVSGCYYDNPNDQCGEGEFYGSWTDYQGNQHTGCYKPEPNVDPGDGDQGGGDQGGGDQGGGDQGGGDQGGGDQGGGDQGGGGGGGDGPDQSDIPCQVGNVLYQHCDFTGLPQGQCKIGTTVYANCKPNNTGTVDNGDGTTINVPGTCDGNSLCDDVSEIKDSVKDLTEEVADNKDQSIIDDLNKNIDDQVEGSGINEFIEGIGEDTVDESGVNRIAQIILPDLPTGCSDFNITLPFATYSVTCSDTRPIRDFLSWVFYIYTAWYLFQLVLTPPNREA